MTINMYGNFEKFSKQIYSTIWIVIFKISYLCYLYILSTRNMNIYQFIIKKLLLSHMNLISYIRRKFIMVSVEKYV